MKRTEPCVYYLILGIWISIVNTCSYDGGNSYTGQWASRAMHGVSWAEHYDGIYIALSWLYLYSCKIGTSNRCFLWEISASNRQDLLARSVDKV